MTLLGIGFVFACTTQTGAWHKSARASGEFTPTSSEAIPPNEITGTAANQTIHSTPYAISYLTIYGTFTDVAGATVEWSSGKYEFSTDIYYWDEDIVIIELMTLPSSCEITEFSRLDDNLTVTVTDTANQKSNSIAADPQPAEIP